MPPRSAPSTGSSRSSADSSPLVARRRHHLLARPLGRARPGDVRGSGRSSPASSSARCRCDSSTDRGIRSLFAINAVVTVVAGLLALTVPGGLPFLLFLVSVWAAVTGFIELYAGLRSSRHASPPRATGSPSARSPRCSRSSSCSLPPDTVTAVGLIGAYLVILGVYLVIGGFSLKWAAAADARRDRIGAALVTKPPGDYQPSRREVLRPAEYVGGAAIAALFVGRRRAVHDARPRARALIGAGSASSSSCSWCSR